ncbi:CBS domain-containing protein [Candidatus Methanomassiliicoccus intestinalis]|uniref:CBS domain-containing protein n=1 Tax=Candidatus Methanomassiliicoccus intestinalis TaxID=1406512 RepID=UPI0037DD2628
MTKIKEVMTHNPITSQIPGSRVDVIKLMVTHNLTGIPIVKKDGGELVGMITRNDIFTKPDEDQLAIIMKKNPETLSPEDSVDYAAAKILETNTTHIPIVEDKQLVGILTPTDLLHEVEKRDGSYNVEDVAISPCVPIFQDSPLRVALATFRASNVNALPALDENGRLSGILTDRDIFNKSLINGSSTITAMGIASDEDEWSWEGLKGVMKMWFEISKVELPSVPVRDIMISRPTTVFSKTAVVEAARIMRRNDFGQLPVVDSKDVLVGMLYDTDIISVLVG